MVLRVVLIVLLGFQIVINLTRPIITLYANDLGATTFEIGILTAMYAFVPLIIAIQAGKITDRIGNRLPVIFGLVGLMLGMLIPYLFPAMWALYVSQLIVGAASIFIAVSLQNVMGNASTDDLRVRNFSMFGLTVAFGALIGPLAGGYIAEHFSYSAAFIVSVGICLLSLFFAFLIPITWKKQKKKNIDIQSSIQLIKNPLVKKALLSSALVLYSRDIFVAYFPLYGKEEGLSTSTIGIILSLQGLSMMVVRFILPRLIKKTNKELVLNSSIIIAGMSFLFFPFASHLFFFCLLSCLMGFGLGCGQPISLTTTYNASPKSRTGEVLGIRLMVNRFSQLIAPLFFGLIGAWNGIMSVFLVSGLFLLGGSFFVTSKKKE